MSNSISGLHQKLEEEKGIHTDFRDDMTYGDYLNLESILSSQNRLSDHHEEMLFIIIHQVNELWMKLILHEVTAAIQAIKKDDMQPAFKMLPRVTKIQSQIIQAWDVLSTLTAAEFLAFRGELGRAPGFQSCKWRRIESALGYKTEQVLENDGTEAQMYEKLKKAYKSPSIYDVSIQALERAGFSINPELLDRDFSKIYHGDPSVAGAWKKVYENIDDYWDLYQLAEKLVDVDDWLQQWRFRHMKTVERIIGFKVGTGVSSGVNYLREVLDHRFFPELWDVRTKL